MNALRLAGAMSLSVGLLVSGRNALAGGDNDRLDETYDLSDRSCFYDGEEGDDNFARIEFGVDVFAVSGAVVGTGTDGDWVFIGYATDLPSSASANDKTGKVTQKRYSELCFWINSEVPNAREINTCAGDEIYPEKCSVKASMNDRNGSGKVNVNCSAVDLFGQLSQEQLDSVLLAFPKGNECGVKLDANDPGKNSRLKIKLKM